MLEKIKKYKWTLLSIVDLIAIGRILDMNIYIHYTDLDQMGGGSWCVSVGKFFFKGIERMQMHGEIYKIGKDFIYPLYLLGISIFLLGIFSVKMWYELRGSDKNE
ncbi:hypothetical protein DRN58_09490 [Thermococci archaeon]|nr:MAG: hypothetical protein DRN58_09490 [Thermococci archaeon]